jgi:hypothetical protein
VFAEDLHGQSLIVQVKPKPNTVPNSEGNRVDVSCWCEVVGVVKAVNFAVLGDASSPFTTATGLVNGVQFKPEREVLPPGVYRVLLKGDYVRGNDKRAVDANHLPPWVQHPTYRSGDGVEGGLFESWLELVQ